MNPLIPSGLDITFAIATVLVFALTVAAFISWARRAASLGGKRSLLWLAAIVLLPLVGPAGWYLAGRATRAVPHQPTEAA